MSAIRSISLLRHLTSRADSRAVLPTFTRRHRPPILSASFCPSSSSSSSSSFSSPFPDSPCGWDPIDESMLPPPTKIDEETICILERQSLVDFANEEGVRTLEAAIRFADQVSRGWIRGRGEEKAINCGREEGMRHLKRWLTYVLVVLDE